MSAVTPVRKMMRRISVMERREEEETSSSSCLWREMILEICFSLSEGWDRVMLVFVLHLSFTD